MAPARPFGRATSNYPSSRVLSRSTPGHRQPSEFRFGRLIGRQAIACASSWSTRSRSSRSRVRTRGAAYECAKNTYIPVDNDELDAIATESTHTIEIDTFVPRAQIDQRYLDGPYYITPNDRVGIEVFAVIREAMRGKSMMALGRIVLAKRAGHHDRALEQGADRHNAALPVRNPGGEKTISTTFPTSSLSPRCSNWPSGFSKARRRISTHHSSWTATRKQ